MGGERYVAEGPSDESWSTMRKGVVGDFSGTWKADIKVRSRNHRTLFSNPTQT